MHKVNVNYRLDDDDKMLIGLLAKHFGISETDVIKMLIKKAADEEEIAPSSHTVVRWQVLEKVLDPSLMKELEGHKEEVPARRKPIIGRAPDPKRG